MTTPGELVEDLREDLAGRVMLSVLAAGGVVEVGPRVLVLWAKGVRDGCWCRGRHVADPLRSIGECG